MASQLFSMVAKFILALFYLANLRQKGMIVFFLIEFLREERYNINIGLFLHLNYDIIDFRDFSLEDGDLNGVKGDEQLSNSVIDGPKC